VDAGAGKTQVVRTQSTDEDSGSGTEIRRSEGQNTGKNIGHQFGKKKLERGSDYQLLWSKQEELKNPNRIEKNSVTIEKTELQRRRNKNGKNMKIQEWFNCHHVVLLSNLPSPLYSRRRSYKAVTWAWPRPTLPTMTAHRARDTPSAR
jgi:hypothetical protein